MVTSSLSERCGAGPGRSKACWIMADPFIVSSTMVKMVVRTVALSSIGSTLLVCLCCLQTKAYYSSHFLSPTSTKRICMFCSERGPALIQSEIIQPGMFTQEHNPYLLRYSIWQGAIDAAAALSGPFKWRVRQSLHL